MWIIRKSGTSYPTLINFYSDETTIFAGKYTATFLINNEDRQNEIYLYDFCSTY